MTVIHLALGETREDIRLEADADEFRAVRHSTEDCLATESSLGRRMREATVQYR